MNISRVCLVVIFTVGFPAVALAACPYDLNCLNNPNDGIYSKISCNFK
jgi:hypothetical protein